MQSIDAHRVITRCVDFFHIAFKAYRNCNPVRHDCSRPSSRTPPACHQPIVTHHKDMTARGELKSTKESKIQ